MAHAASLELPGLQSSLCIDSSAPRDSDAKAGAIRSALLVKAPLIPRLESYTDNMSFDSVEYWRKRYATGGNSGAGSYGALADFKAASLNHFIESNGIESGIEYGSGDGNQLSLLKIKRYIGVDLSPDIIANLRNKFAGDASKTFVEYDPDKYKVDASTIADTATIGSGLRLMHPNSPKSK
jgi:hypothetical protein